MDTNSVLDAIYNRRSVRTFSKEPVDEGILQEILKAGSFAPSGLNNQPWRFVIIKSPETKKSIAALTNYSRIIVDANVLIAVMLDKEGSYHREKDIQAIGACIQNMLLAIHSFGLGGVWLGEILKNKDKFNEIMGIEARYELMAVVAMGHKADKKCTSSRKEVKELIIKEI